MVSAGTPPVVLFGDSSGQTWKSAEIEVFSHAFFAAKIQYLLQRHEIFHANDTLVNPYGIDANIKFSYAVCACFFVFHNNM